MEPENNLWGKLPIFLTLQRMLSVTTAGLDTVKSEMSIMLLNSSYEIYLT